MDVQEKIRSFLSEGPYAVVGASRDREKYGNKVLRCFLQHGREVYAVNPKESEIEGASSFPSLRDLPRQVRGISMITPPKVTAKIIEEVPASGAGFVWMQPGSDSPEAVGRAEELGLTVIAGGPCVLVALGFRDV